MEKLQIKEREIHGKKWCDKKTGAEHEYSIDELGLFDDENPNDKLISFYEEYKEKIEEFKVIESALSQFYK